MADHDVPDSTDWLSTPLTALAAVESSLRCQVCKDFFKTPMITSCSHTFCSLCIRRALSNDGKCPLCRASEQELRLRSNWSIEETVEAFVKARAATLDLARNGGSGKHATKRKTAQDSVEAGNASESKRLRSSARLRSARVETPVHSYQPEEDEIVEVFDDDEYVPEPDDGLVPCPVCRERMKEWQVFRHLEACPGPTPPQPRKEESNSGSGPSHLRRQQTRTIERLPALNYSMLKENALRKKLAELGISNLGPRALLERRHKEWITLWNANCDAARPKRRGELLQDLDVWERTQGGRAPTAGRAIQNATAIKDKDFDGAAWATKHDISFKDLIESARRSRMEAKRKSEESVNTPALEQPPPAAAPAAAPEGTPTAPETVPASSIQSNAKPPERTSGTSRDIIADIPQQILDHSPHPTQTSTSASAYHQLEQHEASLGQVSTVKRPLIDISDSDLRMKPWTPLSRQVHENQIPPGNERRHDSYMDMTPDGLPHCSHNSNSWPGDQGAG